MSVVQNDFDIKKWFIVSTSQEYEYIVIVAFQLLMFALAIQ